jgi:hypothetical protein
VRRGQVVGSEESEVVMTKDQLLLLALLLVSVGVTAVGALMAADRQPRRGAWAVVALLGAAGVVITLALMIT